jgi:spermidine dehydrogenase
MKTKKPYSSSDRALGMDLPITRRDFINGVALLTTAAIAPPSHAQTSSAAPQDQYGYYPPTLTGMRGSHPGSFENAHDLRDGKQAPEATDTGEQYDLIIVGAGISGLAAAHYYRAATSPQSRILLLDNHDDFGGHAKRNEFHINGQLQLMNGGTLEIDSPRPYSKVAANLLTTLGIDVPALAKRTQKLAFYEERGMQHSLFFDRETFGKDYLTVGLGAVPTQKLLANAPLSPTAIAQIAQIEEGAVDYLPGLNSDEKKDRLSRMSYEAFLRDLVKVDPLVLTFYNFRTRSEWGVGCDAVSALDCWGFAYPGFKGMQLKKGSIARMGYTPSGYHDAGGSYHLHFPDGNATIARSLVRNLIPRAIPGRGVENIVTARADYSQLDRADQPIRIRLSSTAIKAHNTADGGVQITYVRDGRTFSARAKGSVLACYNAVIPYLCPDLPEAQKAALHELVKSPLVYTSVALNNWKAFERLNTHRITAPCSYHTSLYLNDHVNIGAYRSPRSAEEPHVLHMVRVPTKPGLSEHEQNRAGRAELLATSFETFERNIRDQLNRCLAGGGFDASRDINAITVNRWPHGYSPEYNPLWDPEVPADQRANVIGRAKFGRISIANSDSGAAAYTDSAIDQAHRAVGELLAS